jgi:hypothetical protein
LEAEDNHGNPGCHEQCAGYPQDGAHAGKPGQSPRAPEREDAQTDWHNGTIKIPVMPNKITRTRPLRGLDPLGHSPLLSHAVL